MKNLIKKLIQKKLKISFAESCTGGMLASSITSISGASKVFNIGPVSYTHLRAHETLMNLVCRLLLEKIRAN